LTHSSSCSFQRLHAVEAQRKRNQLCDSERGAAAHRELRLGPDVKKKAPIVYGYINEDGSTASGSGGFASSYNSSDGWYVISINNVDYFFSSFSTTVTPSLPHDAICDTDSIGGTMLVRCFDLSGNPTQAEFGFITF